MKYVNETVRRQDRLLNEERALQLIRDSEYGVLSMVDADGGAYGLPLNYEEFYKLKYCSTVVYMVPRA